MAVDAAISVQQEIVKRTEQADRLLHLHVERAQYEADLARKRVMSVDPENRLVAQTFEKNWNEKLTLLDHAKHDYERRRKTHQDVLEPARQEKIKQMVADFATVWSHQATTFQDKKRMIRLLIDDVTLKREGHEVEIYIRFKTGAIIRDLFRIPNSGNKPTKIDPQLIEMIDHLSSEHTAGAIYRDSGQRSLTKKALSTPRLEHLIPTRLFIYSNDSTFKHATNGCAQTAIYLKKNLPSTVALERKRFDGGNAVGGSMQNDTMTNPNTFMSQRLTLCQQTSPISIHRYDQPIEET